MSKNPNFQCGNIIDLHYVNGGLPNRIIISAVYKYHNSKEWMYEVLMENSGTTTSMKESFILSRMSKHTAPVYNNKAIKERFAEGFRFCGNYPVREASERGMALRANNHIDRIVLFPALDQNAKGMKGYLALWIKYKNPINDTSVLSALVREDMPELPDDNEVTVIK